LWLIFINFIEDIHLLQSISKMGKPAARVGDMHVCPMVTPGVPPIPHVGGPILPPGCPTVLIGGMPAAGMGDMCTCVGPPDSIVLGSTGVFVGGKPAARIGDQTAHGGAIVMGLPTVLIGETGSGGPGGAAAGGAGSTQAQTFISAAGEGSPQTEAFKDTARNGDAFCPECEAAKNKK
jgi:uncharacterized Zn-binding protein involved in type VI secretion